MDPACQAQLFQEIIKGLGVHKVHMCGYIPNANGLTEQSNNMIKQYLTKYIEKIIRNNRTGINERVN